MKTHVASARTPAELSHAIENAVYLLGAGHLVALPTETVYGLAGWGLDANALLRIFNAKERPRFDPLILHLPTIEWLDQVCAIPLRDRPLIEKLIHSFWPGPLTFILPRKPIVPDIAASGLPTVAVRMSAHPVFKAVVEAFGQPLAAPSANRFGRISPTEAEHVVDELGGRIHLVLDAGPSQIGVESTIVTVRDGKIWIMRQGPVLAEDLRAIAPVEIAARVPLPSAPGQLKSHYAPVTPLKLLPPDAMPVHTGSGRAGLLAFSDDANAEGYTFIEVLSTRGSMQEAAETFFAKLRRLDSLGLDVIHAESVPEQRLGAAIMDRLRKASGNG